jgi:hypothetical protein
MMQPHDLSEPTVPVLTDAWLVRLVRAYHAYNQFLDRFEAPLSLTFVDHLSIPIGDTVLDALGYPPAGTIVASTTEIFNVNRDWFYDLYADTVVAGTEVEIYRLLHVIRTDPRVSVETSDIHMVADFDSHPIRALGSLLRSLHRHDRLLAEVAALGLDLSVFRLSMLDLVFDVYAVPADPEVRGRYVRRWEGLVNLESPDFQQFLTELTLYRTA